MIRSMYKETEYVYKALSTGEEGYLLKEDAKPPLLKGMGGFEGYFLMG